MKRIVTTVCLLAAFLVTFVTVALATTNTPTYHRTVRGNDSVSIPDPHCQTVTSHAYHLRTCLDITTRGDWTPTPLPPGIGGLQGAATHVFGRIRVTYGYSNAAVVPYKVKLWVGNLTNGSYTGKDHFCGWGNTICARHYYGLDVSSGAFVWDYSLPPFFGCDTLVTDGTVQGIVWPNVHVKIIMLFKFLEAKLVSRVCSP